MRRPLLALVVLLLTVPTAARAVDATTPVTVGDRAFTLAEVVSTGKIGAEGFMTAADIRAAGAAALIDGEWHAREAAARGLAADPAALAAAEAQDVRSAGSPEEYATRLAEQGITADQRRAQIADGLLAEAVDDDVLRGASADPIAFGRAFDALAQRERAVTTCAAAVVGAVGGRCGNLAPKAGRCTAMGAEALCPELVRGHRRWLLPGDVVAAFNDPSQAAGASVAGSLARVRRYLAAHAPDALRHCEIDQWDISYVRCARRADAIATAWAIARIHATTKRGWAVPATHGVVW